MSETITNVDNIGGKLRLRITGLKEAAQLVNPITTQAAIAAAMEQGTDVALNALRAATPFKSGKTRKGWRKHVASGDRIEIQNNQPGAVFLFFGARPHRIEAMGHKRLSNVNNSRASYYGLFGPVRAVMHPGFNAEDKFVQAVDYQAGDAAFETVAGMIQGFYANKGSLQRRSTTGAFGSRF